MEESFKAIIFKDLITTSPFGDVDYKFENADFQSKFDEQVGLEKSRINISDIPKPKLNIFKKILAIFKQLKNPQAVKITKLGELKDKLTTESIKKDKFKKSFSTKSKKIMVDHLAAAVIATHSNGVNDVMISRLIKLLSRGMSTKVNDEIIKFLNGKNKELNGLDKDLNGMQHVLTNGKKYFGRFSTINSFLNKSKRKFIRGVLFGIPKKPILIYQVIAFSGRTFNVLLANVQGDKLNAMVADGKIQDDILVPFVQKSSPISRKLLVNLIEIAVKLADYDNDRIEVIKEITNTIEKKETTTDGSKFLATRKEFARSVIPKILKGELVKINTNLKLLSNIETVVSLHLGQYTVKGGNESEDFIIFDEEKIGTEKAEEFIYDYIEKMKSYGMIISEHDEKLLGEM